MVFYRQSNGNPTALLDLCPHRFFPLSKGTLTENGLECGYHGMRFGGDGICNLIPTQDKIPKGARVKSFPLVERHNLIWIWPGDPDQADENQIPSFQTDPAHRSGLNTKIAVIFLGLYDQMSLFAQAIDT